MYHHSDREKDAKWDSEEEWGEDNLPEGVTSPYVYKMSSTAAGMNKTLFSLQFSALHECYLIPYTFIYRTTLAVCPIFSNGLLSLSRMRLLLRYSTSIVALQAVPSNAANL